MFLLFAKRSICSLVIAKTIQKKKIETPKVAPEEKGNQCLLFYM